MENPHPRGFYTSCLTSPGGEIRVIFAELVRKREAVLLHDRAALWAGEEGGEGARGLFLLSSLYDPQALVQGFV